MKNANFGVPNSDRYQCWPKRKLPTAHLAAPPRATCMLQDFFGSGCSWLRITVGDAEVLVLPKSLAYVFSCWFEFATCHLAPIIRSSIRETCRPQYSAQDIAGIQMYGLQSIGSGNECFFPPNMWQPTQNLCDICESSNTCRNCFRLLILRSKCQKTPNKHNAMQMQVTSLCS